jgi:hypothetical protein
VSPDKVDELNARTNRWLRRLAVVVAVLLVCLNAITAAGVAWTAVDSLKQARTNGQTLAVLRSVTGCTAVDTPEQCHQRLRDSTTAEGARRTAEVDCLTRRALAGLPAPIPPTTCIDQTPRNIYPGGTP